RKKERKKRKKKKERKERKRKKEIFKRFNSRITAFELVNKKNLKYLETLQNICSLKAN
uniref:Uncharacterized protein n=1 Tax=Macaca fascicularis TaxID=9541 RepID=A0A7N9CC22_MACFA